MSTRRLELERVHVDLDGVSAEQARAALTGLEHELRRQLAGVAPEALRGEARARVRLRAAELPAGPDAGELRRVIAGQLIAALRGEGT